MARVALAVAVALAVLLAGCVAPAASPAGGPGADAAPTDSSDDGIRVDGGELPADPDRTFERVQAILGSDAAPPDEVRVRSVDERPGAPDDDADLPPFFRIMGVDRSGEAPPDATAEVGGTTSYGGVVVYRSEDADPTTLRWVLAHELVHAVQFRNGRPRQVGRNVSAGTTDGSFVVRSLLEGVAVRATDAYIDRHLDTDETNAALYDRRREQLPPGSLQRYVNSMYVYGTDYAGERLEDPARADRLYRDPPRTSEQVIHGHAPGEEPPRALTVTVESDDEWSTVGTDRMGEGWTRIALRNGLNESAADRAAAGWGNDSLVTLWNGDRRGFVWVLRFDDAREADEFHGLFGTYLDARGNRSGGVWTIANETVDPRRVAPETVAVVVGPGSMVANATVSGSNESVAVDATGRTAAAVPARGPRTGNPGSIGDVTAGGPVRRPTAGGVAASG